MPRKPNKNAWAGLLNEYLTGQRATPADSPTEVGSEYHITYLTIPGLSSAILSRNLKRRTAYSVVVCPEDGVQFSAESFGDSEMLTPELGAEGFSMPIYSIFNGSFAGHLVQVQKSPSKPDGHQAILRNLEYFVHATDVSESWLRAGEALAGMMEGISSGSQA